jgi:hypothetical protein
MAVRGAPSGHGQTCMSGRPARRTCDQSGGAGPVTQFVFAVLLVVALLLVVAMWAVWRRASARTTRGRVARVASVVVTLFAVALVARLFVAPLPSERTLTWKMGFGYDPTSADVLIEVERPYCAPDGDAWIAPPVVTSTPLAVFITVRMADTFNVPGCLGILGYDPWSLPFGPLPGVGGYLTGTSFGVHLTQPLGLRVLFDGSGLIPEQR